MTSKNNASVLDKLYGKALKIHKNISKYHPCDTCDITRLLLLKKVKK